MVLFAATELGVGGRGVSAFLVPIDATGLSRTAIDGSLGVRGLGCMDLELDDVSVDTEAMLGEPGQGFRIAMWALDGGRVAIGAQALGVGQAAFDEALAHAKCRHTFGRPIAEYQAIQWMLADMAIELDAAHRAADTAMQILASAGYRRGTTVERLFRDVWATEIYQGTSEVQRMVIASQVLGLD